MAIENFFDDHPTITYTLDNGSNVQIVTDIFRRVILNEELINNTNFYETYDVVDNETPEDVSYKFYGTTYLHWLVLLVNNVVNPMFEWPKNQRNLIDLVEKKYGSDSIFTITKAKNSNNREVETFFLLTENSTHKNPIRLSIETNDENSMKQPIEFQESQNINDYVSNYEIEEEKFDSYRSIRILKQEYVSQIISSYKELVNV